MPDRKAAIMDLANSADPIRRFGITRDEIIEAVGFALARSFGPGVDDLVTISLAVASQWSGLTREEIRRRARTIDHGRRNQRITLSEYRKLITPKPKETQNEN